MRGPLPCRRWWRIAAAGGISLIAVAQPAVGAAQLVATADAGATVLTYADSLRLVATTVAPAVRYSGGRLAFHLGATVSALESGSWALGGTGGGVLRVARIGPLWAQLASTAAFSTYPGAGTVGAADARALLRLDRRGSGVWLGGGGGTRLGAARPPVAGTLEVGAWTQRGAAGLSTTLTAVHGPDTLRYLDAALGARLDAGRLGIRVAGGLRTGARTPRLWSTAEAVLRLRGALALVGVAGTVVPDPLSGAPSTRYVGLALRLTRRGPGGAPRARARTPAGARPAAPVALAEISACTLRVRADGAVSVEVMGDFTGWQALALAPAGDGWWAAGVCIASGVYQVLVRRDGGEWIAPPGLPLSPDGYGGVAGLLIVQ